MTFGNHRCIIRADLAVYKRAGDMKPAMGPEYSFEFLWRSLERRVNDHSRKVATVAQDAARKKELQKLETEAARYAAMDKNSYVMSAAEYEAHEKKKKKLNNRKEKQKAKALAAAAGGSNGASADSSAAGDDVIDAEFTETK